MKKHIFKMIASALALLMTASCGFVGPDDTKEEAATDKATETQADDSIEAVLPDGAAWMFHEGVLTVGDSGFDEIPWKDHVYDIKEVIILDGVKAIDDSAFEYCESLESVTIPDSVTSIGAYAFQWCGAITQLNIPSSVKTIGESAFAYCMGITSLSLPDSVETIGDSAFSRLGNLTSLTLPNGGTSIGNYAFAGCDELTSVSIPAGVLSIGAFAFAECENLTTVTIDNIESGVPVGNDAFPVGCTVTYNQ